MLLAGNKKGGKRERKRKGEKREKERKEGKHYSKGTQYTPMTL